MQGDQSMAGSPGPETTVSVTVGTMLAYPAFQNEDDAYDRDYERSQGVGLA